MIKRIGLFVLTALAILHTGCIDTHTEIAVKKDGSGILTQTTYLDVSAGGMFRGMHEETEEKEEESETGSGHFEKYEEKAMKMGRGVKLISAREVENEEGMTGVEAVYAFDDIESLNIDAYPENPMEEAMEGMIETDDPQKEESEGNIYFEFKRGNTAELIIHMPKRDKADMDREKDEDDDETAIMDSKGRSQGLEMMKLFMKNLRIRVEVRLLDGKIRETNAAFVEKENRIILMDISFDQIMSDPSYREKMGKLSETRDMEKAMQAVGDMPGLKYETAERVRVVFQ